MIYLYTFYIIFFFFSSRRRHTRCYRDWSSDVCSSDLAFLKLLGVGAEYIKDALRQLTAGRSAWVPNVSLSDRSEERRVGKECMSRRSSDYWNNRRWIHTKY